MTEVGGIPLIVGAWFGAALTVIVNAGSCAVSWPSLTLIVMFANAPMLALVGVPARRPFAVLNVAQLGLFRMLNVSVVPALASVAVGVNVY